MDAAVKTAIDLMQLPGQTRHLRTMPLPDDVVVLLEIASGDEQATRHAADKVGRTTEMVREAAAFFIIQILFCPEADSYRVLGAKPEAPVGELRRNMRLLLRWLHPDLNPISERSIFAARVTRAWNDLKTPERRAAYFEQQRKGAQKKSGFPHKERSVSKSRGGVLNKRREHAGIGHPGRGPHRLSRVYIPRRIGFLQRLLIQLLGRPIL
jgi:hypothetical protein